MCIQKRVLLLACLLPGLAYAADGYNSKWSSRDKTQAVSIFIHDREGNCDTLKDAALAIGTKDLKPGSSASSIDAKNLDFCLLFLGGEKSENCAGGTVELTYDSAQNTYRGKYQLSFKSGKKRSGEIRALFCKSQSKKGS